MKNWNNPPKVCEEIGLCIIPLKPLKGNFSASWDGIKQMMADPNSLIRALKGYGDQIASVKEK